ncbi:hypothetical protein Tco_1546958 [Tanacetum coccineum]
MISGCGPGHRRTAVVPTRRKTFYAGFFGRAPKFLTLVDGSTTTPWHAPHAPKNNPHAIPALTATATLSAATNSNIITTNNLLSHHPPLSSPRTPTHRQPPPPPSHSPSPRSRHLSATRCLVTPPHPAEKG